MTIAQEVRTRRWAMLIGDEWRGSSDGRTMVVGNPARAETLAEVPLASSDDVGRAVTAAQEAFPGWWHLGSPERAARLQKIAKLVREHADDLAWLDAANSGNPITSAKTDVIRGTGRHFEEPASLLQEVHGVTVPASHPGDLHFTLREPYGVAGIIIPYNHATSFAMMIGGPLAMGNTVVLKLPDQAPLPGLLFAELCQQVFPPGVVNIITGDGATTGSALARHPGVPLIVFTGSVVAGRRVVQAGAETAIKKTILELGGKNPLIVCSDADLSRASQAAVRGMNLQNCQGQSCQSTSRVLVHRSLRQELVERIAAGFEQISPGDPLDPEAQMGCLVTHAHRDRVMSYVNKGKEEGAHLVTGGDSMMNPDLARGAFVPPTLFDKVTPSMTIAHEEIFGPVLSVIEWDTEDEAIRICNGVDYGLTAALWTRDLERAQRMIPQIQAGRVFVNSPIGGYTHVPFGYYKDSGLGVTNSLEGLAEYTQVKAVHMIGGGS